MVVTVRANNCPLYLSFIQSTQTETDISQTRPGYCNIENFPAKNRPEQQQPRTDLETVRKRELRYTNNSQTERERDCYLVIISSYRRGGMTTLSSLSLVWFDWFHDLLKASCIFIIDHCLFLFFVWTAILLNRNSKETMLIMKDHSVLMSHRLLGSVAQYSLLYWLFWWNWS